MHNPVVLTTSRNNHVHRHAARTDNPSRNGFLTTFYPPGKTPPKRGVRPPFLGGWRYTKQCKFWRDSSVLIQGVRRFLRTGGVFFGSFFDPQNDPQKGGVRPPPQMAHLTHPVGGSSKSPKNTPRAYGVVQCHFCRFHRFPRPPSDCRDMLRNCCKVCRPVVAGRVSLLHRLTECRGGKSQTGCPVPQCLRSTHDPGWCPCVHPRSPHAQ
jgi:hypothetical protein